MQIDRTMRIVFIHMSKFNKILELIQNSIILVTIYINNILKVKFLDTMQRRTILNDWIVWLVWL